MVVSASIDILLHKLHPEAEPLSAILIKPARIAFNQCKEGFLNAKTNLEGIGTALLAIVCSVAQLAFQLLTALFVFALQSYRGEFKFGAIQSLSSLALGGISLIAFCILTGVFVYFMLRLPFSIASGGGSTKQP